MQSAERAIISISRWFNYIGMIFLVFLMLLITFDVIFRYTMNRPIRGANELSELVMVLAVFLAIAYTQYMKSHIKVDILYIKFPQKVQDSASIFINLLCLGVCVLIVYQSIQYQILLWDINRASLILKIPIAPFQLVLILGFTMFSLVFLLDLIHSILRVTNK